MNCQNSSVGQNENEHVADRMEKLADLPDLVLPQEVALRYQTSIVDPAKDTTVWDVATQTFQLRPTAPDLFITPLRSGPIAKTGYDAYCERHNLPQPPVLIISGVGSETRDAFLRHLERYEPSLDWDEWEEEEVQQAFRSWVVNTSYTPVRRGVKELQDAIATIQPRTGDTLNLLFVDDAGGLYEDVRGRVTPAILSAALGNRAFVYSYHLLFPSRFGYPDEPSWYDRVVRETFGQDLPFEQRDFLYQALRGSIDDFFFYDRQDILIEYASDLCNGAEHYLLDRVSRLQILSELLRRNRQDFYTIAYPDRIAKDGFAPLFAKYGDQLLCLQERLIEALQELGRQAPTPTKM